MLSLIFANPGFLLIGAALISVPIIIHLINRMRFKRIRWAAMEFLLKAQKRTRRRLIIEQLLLLALRCLLIFLALLLVARFVGCSDNNLGKPNLHIVLLDDTLSTQDTWKQEGAAKNSFDVARNDVLIKTILKGVSQGNPNDRLVIVQLSKLLEKDYEPKSYEKLGDETRRKEAEREIADIEPSMTHVSALRGLKVVKEFLTKYADTPATLHLVGDFRHRDWTGADGDALVKELVELANKNKDKLKIRPTDTVSPKRELARGGIPASRDNVGILDFRPNTRIVGKNMPVQFNISIMNFGSKQIDVSLMARDETTGKDMFDINFNPHNPIKLIPGKVTMVTFEHRFTDVKAGESNHAHLSVRMLSPQLGALENDALAADNIRWTSVEVRERVPVLVIDGDPKGRDEGKDSFFLRTSLISVPGSYSVVFADELNPGNPTKALERPDLNQYPTIILANVRDMTPKQLANLENYANDGGGVAIFMGPLANAAWYNKSMYREGKGLFPAPIKDNFFPPPNEPELEARASDSPQLLIRDDEFGSDRDVPIFGKMFPDPQFRAPLNNLPIKRYFQVNRAQWKRVPGKVFELATLPNEAPANASGAEVKGLIDTLGRAILGNNELQKYHARLKTHLDEIEQLARPESDARAFQLANRIQYLLTDRGSSQAKFRDTFPDMTEFWANSDDKVLALKGSLERLRAQVNYGDPFVVAQSFGKGKVVAIMSTAGKDWNDWGGGSAASILYAPFIWELQNYLSSSGTDANLTVGAEDVKIELDADSLRGIQPKIVRLFKKAGAGNKVAEDVKLGDVFPTTKESTLVFPLERNLQPGLYLSHLVDQNAPDKAPIASFAHVFNVDTASEGDLRRVSSDELKQTLIEPAKDTIRMSDELVPRKSEFSESPWLFLILLLVLVAEQALAVHLSFHLKKNEDDGPTLRARS